MDIAIIFGGVLVSLVVEFTKKKFNLNAAGVMIFVAVLSLLGGVAYKLLLTYGLWEAFIGVIASAGAFYAFIIKNVKDISSSPVEADLEA